MNEILVLISIYPVLTFTDFVWDLNAQMDNGSFIIGCILLNIGANIIVIIAIALNTLIKKCRIIFYRRRMKKAMEKKRQEVNEKI